VAFAKVALVVWRVSLSIYLSIYRGPTALHAEPGCRVTSPCADRRGGLWRAGIEEVGTRIWDRGGGMVMCWVSSDTFLVDGVC
jgi:hypothetical protein